MNCFDAFIATITNKRNTQSPINIPARNKAILVALLRTVPFFFWLFQHYWFFFFFRFMTYLSPLFPFFLFIPWRRCITRRWKAFSFSKIFILSALKAAVLWHQRPFFFKNETNLRTAPVHNLINTSICTVLYPLIGVPTFNSPQQIFLRRSKGLFIREQRLFQH